MLVSDLLITQDTHKYIHSSLPLLDGLWVGLPMGKNSLSLKNAIMLYNLTGCRQTFFYILPLYYYDLMHFMEHPLEYIYLFVMTRLWKYVKMYYQDVQLDWNSMLWLLVAIHCMFFFFFRNFSKFSCPFLLMERTSESSSLLKVLSCKITGFNCQ